MKNTFSLIVLLLLISSTLPAQLYNSAYIGNDTPPTYGDSYPSSMISQTDGSVLTLHNIKEGPGSPQPEASDAHVLKVDALGQVIWSKKFGGEGYDDKLNGICQTDDGGYLVVGSRGKIFNAVRSWILKLDANGNILWDRLFLDQHDTEHLLVARTSEASESYFVVGYRTSQYSPSSTGYITAMKVDAFGTPAWGNAYTPPDQPIKGALSANIPTAMVEDLPNNGFVIAGLKTGSRDFFGFPSARGDSDVFAIGIDLDGFVYTDFVCYDVQPSNSLVGCRETAPHINLNVAGNGFVMAFGIDSNCGIPKDPISHINRIIYMPLSNNLQAGIAFDYEPTHNRGARANSIYPNAEGGYAIGCSGHRTEDGALYFDDSERVSFLKIDQDGSALTYKSYDTGTNAGSNFMVEKSGGYMLKADETETNYPLMRLINVDLNGNSDCTNQRTVITRMAGVLMDRESYGPIELPLSNFQFTLPQVSTYADRINCSSNAPRSEATLEESASFSAFKAYPTLVDHDITEIELEFQLKEAQELEIGILNSNGQLIKFFNYSGVEGNNKYQLETDYLNPGVNTILLYSSDDSVTFARIVKL